MSSKKHKVPELLFFPKEEGEECIWALISYKKAKFHVILDPKSLCASREAVIEACIDLKVPPTYIAVWQERIYRWYLDQGNPKVR